MGLDTEVYDYSASANCPVIGSSELRKNKQDKVHWDPVEKDVDFNPNQRWSSWPRSRHERFNWIAGDYLTKFDYEPKLFKGQRGKWFILNLIMDVILKYKLICKRLWFAKKSKFLMK